MFRPLSPYKSFSLRPLRPFSALSAFQDFVFPTRKLVLQPVTSITPPGPGVCDTTSCDPNARLGRDAKRQSSLGRSPVLRALFISLSESRSLRGMAERSAIGQRLSSRFVAGNEVEDAIRVAADLNKRSIGVTVDNLGENVTNVEE